MKTKRIFSMFMMVFGLGLFSQTAQALTCTIQTVNGRYLTAVGGGGRVTDVIHSDATRLLDWEKFTFISLGGGMFAIRTFSGNYLTAVSGGRRTTDVIHSDATRIRAWERFRVRCRN